MCHLPLLRKLYYPSVFAHQFQCRHTRIERFVLESDFCGVCTNNEFLHFPSSLLSSLPRSIRSTKTTKTTKQDGVMLSIPPLVLMIRSVYRVQRRWSHTFCTMQECRPIKDRTGPPTALSSTRERSNRGFIHPSQGSSVVVVWKVSPLSSDRYEPR